MESNKCLQCSKEIKNFLKFKYCFICSRDRKKQYELEHPDKCLQCDKSIKMGYKLCYDCNSKKVIEPKKSYVDDYLL